MTHLPLQILLSVTAVVASFAVIPSIGHAAEIGSGFFCNGTTITNKRNKTVSLSSAKRTIQNKIDALGNSRSAKTKKAALKVVKSDLAACSNGTFFPGNIGGTYTGTLTRSAFNGSSSLCDYDETVSGSFVVTVDGATVSISGASGANPFHIPVSGKRKGSGYELTGTSGAVYRKNLKIVLSNVTDSTATFSAVRSGSAFSPIKKQFVTVCSVTYPDVTFSRLQ